ncbi:Arginase [Beijerinckiaceae bacterium RH AL1]|nr:arginase [Beijerinckiaceae bacterium]VVB43051.1 Arginase [Beijerinckiaceae bacterium RH AL8]VVB43064.1 Arginase [Beijerinckiaceae bacterium RH CH11]VVC53643.1 Arginase [Beijerinckiaceae bacterium RH AL1]
MATRNVALIGAPIDLGTHEPGPAIGPAFLRTAGLAASLRQLGLQVRDEGDVPAPPALPAQSAVANARNLAEVAAWSRALSDAVAAALDAQSLPIVLGGDHCLSIGSIDGVARHCAAQGRELFVLWLDAHADINTPATSPSGNMHGMPLAALTGQPGFGDAFASRPLARLDQQNLFMFGIRSVDPGERELIRALDLEVVDMRRIDEEGVVAPLRRILDRVAARDGLLHVSFDVDFLDPSVAPGVGTTVPGGATYREAHLVMEMLHESGLVGSLDVVEMNPFLDVRGQSALTIVELLASLFGRTTIDRAGTPAFQPDTGRPDA